MDTFPKIGMKFEQARKRILKYDSINKFNRTEIKDSLINQVRLHEGDRAAEELSKETSSYVSSFKGSGNKQNGIDICHKCKGILPKYCSCKKGSE